MAKYIHTPTYDMVVDHSATAFPICLDISSEMTRLTGRMNRQGANWHVGGINLMVAPAGSSAGFGNIGTEVTLTGKLRYLAPTRGRVKAWRSAYKQWRDNLKLSGQRPNRFQDFRITPTALNSYANSLDGLDGQVYPSIPNISTLDGITGLACFNNGGAEYEVFNSHNAQVVYNTPTLAEMFPEGLKTRLDEVVGSQSDMVLNDEILMKGNSDLAEDDFAEIPFTASYDSQNQVWAWTWDANPNAYLSVFLGVFDIQFDNVATDGESALGLKQFDCKISFEVVGSKKFIR
jgi:hypothetical protein